MFLNVASYDHIILPDQSPYHGSHVWQLLVSGEFAAGMKIFVQQDSKQVEFVCSDGDTPATVAKKIAAVWNTVYPSEYNTTAPRNEQLNVINPITATYTNMVQLFTPAPGEFSFTYQVAPAQTAITPAKKTSTWLWLSGGLLLLLLAKRKNKK